MPSVAPDLGLPRFPPSPPIEIFSSVNQSCADVDDPMNTPERATAKLSIFNVHWTLPWRERLAWWRGAVAACKAEAAHQWKSRGARCDAASLEECLDLRVVVILAEIMTRNVHLEGETSGIRE